MLTRGCNVRTDKMSHCDGNHSRADILRLLSAFVAQQHDLKHYVYLVLPWIQGSLGEVRSQSRSSAELDQTPALSPACYLSLADTHAMCSPSTLAIAAPLLSYDAMLIVCSTWLRICTPTGVGHMDTKASNVVLEQPLSAYDKYLDMFLIDFGMCRTALDGAPDDCRTNGMIECASSVYRASCQQACCIARTICRLRAFHGKLSSFIGWGGGGAHRTHRHLSRRDNLQGQRTRDKRLLSWKPVQLRLLGLWDSPSRASPGLSPVRCRQVCGCKDVGFRSHVTSQPRHEPQAHG
jgi:serine/threonine protein kinase